MLPSFLASARRLAQALAVAAVAASPLLAHAAYPDRPVTLIVPYAPGGSADAMGRALAELMRKELGQTVIVENKAGANTAIGAKALAAAPPDGYTLLLATASTVELNPLLNPKLGYEPAQLLPVTRVATTPLVLVTRADSPLHTLPELLARAKAQPGQLNYGTTGVGSSLHLAAELLQVETGTTMTHVPYKGSAPALTGVLGGETHFMVDGVGSSIPLIKGGKLIALAVTGSQRVAALPQVPTVAESGYPRFDVQTWYGLMVPRNTPEEVIMRIHKAAAAAMHDKPFREQFEALGMQVPEPTSPAEFRALISAETAKWAALIKAKKISID